MNERLHKHEFAVFVVICVSKFLFHDTALLLPKNTANNIRNTAFLLPQLKRLHLVF